MPADDTKYVWEDVLGSQTQKKGKGKRKKFKELLVKWAGHDKATWEPVSNLPQELIDSYHNKLADEAQMREGGAAALAHLARAPALLAADCGSSLSLAADGGRGMEDAGVGGARTRHGCGAVGSGGVAARGNLGGRDDLGGRGGRDDRAPCYRSREKCSSDVCAHLGAPQ